LNLEPPTTVGQLRACGEAAEAGIVAPGKARPEDKTVLDAMHPLTQSLLASEVAGDDLATGVALAVQAARDGAASTAGMIATIGRASRLGERSRGWADPGATSFAIFVSAMAMAMTGEPLVEENTVSFAVNARKLACEPKPFARDLGSASPASHRCRHERRGPGCLALNVA
jgi:dihydroxyacetone kinase